MKMKKAYAAALAAAMVLTAGFSAQADEGKYDSITVGDILGGSGIQMNGDGSIIATGPITSTHVNAGKLDVAGGKFRVDGTTGKVTANGGMTVNGDVLMQNGQGEGIVMTQGGAQITSFDMENGTGSVTVKDGGVTLIGNSTTQVNVDKDGTTFIDRTTGMSTTISGNQITTGSINAAGGKFSVDGATGNMSTEGSLTVEDGATINGGTTMNGGATVNGGLTADTISAMNGNFNVNEEGIHFRTEDAADLTTYHYYFDMNNEKGISFGHSNGASMSLNENGVTFAYGSKETHINGDEISTGTVHAGLVQASDMYIGDANKPENQVVTKGELNQAVADGTENAVKYDDNGELHAGKEGTGKLDLTNDGAALTSGNGEHRISVTDNGTTVTGGMTVEGGMTVSGGLKIDNGDGTTSSVVTDADLSDVKEKVEQNTSDISGIKTDVSGIKDQIGSETLKTTSQTLTGAINENHNAIQTNKEAIGDVSALKGTDANGNKYTNLTDAVNGNYDAIQQTQTQVQQNTNAISSLSSQVNDLGGEIDNVGAISSALAGLHPLDYDGTGSKFQLAAAMGSYDGAQAAAIGGFYHFNEDVMMSVGGATAFDGDKKTAFNVGVSFRVGQGSSGKKVNSDDVLAQLNAMNEKIAALEAENQQLSEKVAALEGGEGAEAAEAE